MPSAEAPDGMTRAERVAASILAWRFALPAYLAGTLLAGALWWRITTWLNPTTWWPWPYFLPQFTITYGDNGFTRRALPGTVADLLGVEPSIGAVKLFYVAGVAVADERRRQGAVAQSEGVRAGAAFLAVGALFAYVLLYGSADLASLQQSAARLGQEVEVDGYNLYFSYVGFDAHPEAWASCFMRNDPARAIDLVLTIAFLSLQAFALFAWSDRFRMSLAQVAIVGPIAMAVIALDIGRYAAFASTALWLYFFMALQTERPERVFGTKTLLLLAALTALGPLGVTDGFQSLKGVLDSLVGAHSPTQLGAICNAELR